MTVAQEVGAIVRVVPRARRHRTTFLRALLRRPQLLLAIGGYESALALSGRVRLGAGRGRP